RPRGRDPFKMTKDPHMPTPGANYRIAYHRIVENQLQVCIDSLITGGWDKEDLVRVLQAAEERLQHDPWNCGEPLFRNQLLELVAGLQDGRESLLVDDVEPAIGQER